MLPNGQLSKLGDGITKMKAIGEIHETFYRGNKAIIYKAVVSKSLSSPFIGGTQFLKDNGIEQDFRRNVIHLDDRKVTVQPTDPVSLLPTAPIVAAQKVTPRPSSCLLKFTRRTLLPGQSQVMSVEQKDGNMITVEPWEQNENSRWPEAQLKTVQNGTICLHNSTNNAILLGTEVKQCKIRWGTDSTVNQSEDPNYYSYSPKLSTFQHDGSENIQLIQHNKEVSKEANEIIEDAHSKYSKVFNNDLSKGYNGFYGTHQCHLNWATKERPSASKVRVPSYDHELKGLQQELMDELTDQGVLLIPQEHDIKVQSQY